MWNVHQAFETPGQFLRQLCETPDGVRYISLARDVSKPGGAFLIKLFQGTGFDDYVRGLRRRYEKVVIRKPDASRDRSREVYVIAKEFRG